MLKDITFTLEKGEYITILGANGSGKSTLLKVLDLLLPPQSGYLSIFGLDVKERKNAKAIRSRIALLFQNPESSMISRNVLEEVMFSSLNFGIPYEEAKAKALRSLERFGLSGYGKRAVKDLSGGEKQRLALSALFSSDPEIIILDEAFSYLDRKARILLECAINEEKNRGKGIISVTHSAEIASLSDRILLLSGGRIIKDGKSPDVLKDIRLLEKCSIRAREEDIFMEAVR